MTEIQHDKLPLSKNTTVAKRERVKRMNKQSQITLTAEYCKRYARCEVRGRGTIAEDWKRKRDVALEKLKVCRFWFPNST